jgi:DNA-binding transcriptional regulator PaaX
MKKQSKKRVQARIKRYTLFDEMAASPTELLPQDWRTYQLTRMYEGLAAMEKAPTPTTDDWRVVSDAVNLMETLIVDMKVCEDTSGLLMDAITAMAMAGKRNMAGGAIRLDGAGIQAVRAVLEDYAALLDMLPARTMIRCHRLTEKRIHELLDGKRKPHDVEITAV